MKNGVKPMDRLGVILRPHSMVGTSPAQCPVKLSSLSKIFEVLEDQGIGTFNLTIGSWVSHGGPIDTNAVVIAEL